MRSPDGFHRGAVQVVDGAAAYLIGEALRMAVPLTDALDGWVSAGTISPGQAEHVRAVASGIQAAGSSWLSLAKDAGANTPARLAADVERLAPELMSTTEAAQMLNVTPARVGQLAREGAIAGSKVGTSWAFTRAALDAYMANQEGAA